MIMTATSSMSSTNVIVGNTQISGSDDLQTIIITNGVIKYIGSDTNSNVEATQYAHHEFLDAQGCLASPGFTDLYTRLREPGMTRKGTIASESYAALRAGFTRLLCTPDTKPAIDSLATVELIKQRSASRSSGAQIIPMAALTIDLQGDNLSELATLQAAGCPVASQADSPLLNTNVLYSAMEYAASFDLPLLMTARDAQLGADGCAHSGAIATQLGLPPIPIAAETVALTRLVELCKETGCQIHISRISSARAVQQINDAKQAGVPVTCDVGIHHLFYTDELLAGYDSAFHSAVPFRGQSDRQALRQGLKSGIIDAICSDHSPHDKDAGLAPFPDTEPGLSAYDWFIPLLMQVPGITDLSLQNVLAKLTQAPASLLKLEQPVGIDCANTADFFLLATEGKPAAIERILSAGDNNPLNVHLPESLGLQPLTGRIKAVFTNGSMTRLD